MKWWGWGAPEKRHELSPTAREMLHARLGEPEPGTRVELDEVSLPRRRTLPRELLATLSDAGAVRRDREARIRHATGRSYPDLVRLRSGRLDAAPDAVVSPEDADAVGAVIDACSRAEIAVVPFGGGTSVVGGVDAHRGEHRAVISLDLSRLCSVRVDRTSLLAQLGAGLRGPQAEAALAGHGLTLGHFPQSFEYATVGGFAATRSAGQASSGYGRFDALVAGLRMRSPAGELRTLDAAHTAAGPSLRELALGSEGTLGAITEVTARVRPIPQARRYEAWMAPGWEQGKETLRRLAQEDAMPDVLRLSDREETRVSMALSSADGAGRRMLDTYLRLRRREEGCLLICGWEGSERSVERRRAVSVNLVRRGGSISLGRAGGESWRRGRFEGPYLRDELMGLGYMVDTLETSHTWAELAGLYGAVGSAVRETLEEQGTPGILFCHVSHTYRDGASLYFTFIAPRRPGAELEQWAATKRAASEAIVACGGTITHHHGVGRDHAPYMEAEIGALGLDALRALKETLDPVGVMNPGKLL